jgi:hypothetical protein
MTHDYVWRGTTSLFAALITTTSGLVIAQDYQAHRHQEFLRLLEFIDVAVPDGAGSSTLSLDIYASKNLRTYAIVSPAAAGPSAGSSPAPTSTGSWHASGSTTGTR